MLGDFAIIDERKGKIFMSTPWQIQSIAHRGGARLAPENTLVAFQNALTLGVDAVELDVHMSSDGHLIVFHDNTLERLTDGSGNILDRDFAYLRSLNAAAHFHGGWPKQEQIPTLHEVLSLVKGRARVLVELKASSRGEGAYGRYSGLVSAVLEDIRALDMLDDILLISFDWDLLGTVKELEPAMQTGIIVAKENWNAEEPGAIAGLCERAKDLRCEWIDIHHQMITPELVRGVQQVGLRLATWTPNTREDLQRCKELGVEALTTDCPDLFPLL
ncbi:glycerophosphodiester phosphodiesterase [Ktedonospora formicarum]|uniref:Glycerophosphoryl diester phosphodiesterase n=1 Tax=Ktedonospora formicarum TaxID=2778364 RepID=A0A8J3HS96_9CHLR|nr:glycerophosphodiester phosphodiesterase [Ktedonospora formicarum]GHO43007.1 glycerophosphoryl diester phosphodiesterase [Ktedonospora formicarum]